MITLTIDSHHIPNQKKTNSKLQILKILQFWKKTLHATHLLMLLDKMYKYEMDPTRTLGATERTRNAGRTDELTDRRTDGVKPIYPPTTSLCQGYKNYQPARLTHF